jgi:hypothetical protein
MTALQIAKFVAQARAGIEPARGGTQIPVPIAAVDLDEHASVEDLAWYANP